MEDLGFSRVVLARETSLDELEFIKNNTNIELEVFIHGALCISYSGQCLISSMIGGRSRKPW
jgi:putative protease